MVTSSAVVIGDQQLRPAHQRHRDHHALAHAAGQLVRILVRAARRVGQAHALQRFDRRAPGLGLADAAVHAHRLGHLPAHRQDRVQRAHRLLEDHRHAVAAQIAQLAFRRLQQVAPAEQDVSRCGAHGPRRQQPHQGQRRQALAATAFADDGQRLARLHVEAQLAHQRVEAVTATHLEPEAVDL